MDHKLEDQDAKEQPPARQGERYSPEMIASIQGQDVSTPPPDPVNPASASTDAPAAPPVDTTPTTLNTPSTFEGREGTRNLESAPQEGDHDRTPGRQEGKEPPPGWQPGTEHGG